VLLPRARSCAVRIRLATFEQGLHDSGLLGQDRACWLLFGLRVLTLFAPLLTLLVRLSRVQIGRLVEHLRVLHFHQVVIDLVEHLRGRDLRVLVFGLRAPQRVLNLLTAAV